MGSKEQEGEKFKQGSQGRTFRGLTWNLNLTCKEAPGPLYDLVSF